MTKILILVISFLATASGQSGSNCPKGWVANGDQYCYFFSQTLWGFDQARSICRARGGDLVGINSPAEGTFIYDILKYERYHAWIGLRKNGTKWKWVDGSTPGPDNANITNWKPNYPENNECGWIEWGPKQWRDSTCTTHRRFICKRSNAIMDLCDVENDWHWYSGKCFKYFTDDRTWYDARRVCQDNSGDLAILNTAERLNIFQEIISCKDYEDAIWIGASDIVNAKNLRWVDNSTLSSGSKNWDIGQPKWTNTDGDNCVMSMTLNSYKWQVASGSSEFKFVCERHEGTCANGWYDGNNGFCYWWEKDQTKTLTWPDAKQRCEDIGGFLMKITSAADQEIMKHAGRDLKAAPGITEYYMGLSDMYNDNTLTWADGTPMTYDNRNPPWSQKVTQRMDCGGGRTGSNEGKWAVNYCFRFRSYICQIPIHTRPQQVDNPPVEWNCPQGWKLSVFGQDAKCYFFSDDNVNSWSAARTKCTSQGADLATVKNWADSRVMSRSTVAGAYFGLQNNGGSWQWIDGSRPSWPVHNWAVNEPDKPTNKTVGKTSVVNSAKGQWRSEYDNYPDGRKYVCQMAATHVNATPPPTIATPPWSSKCGIGWNYDPIGNNCFRIVNEKRFTFAQARAECQKDPGSDIISIRGPEENNYMTALIHMKGTVSGYWIGLNDQDRSSGWKWTDGSPVAYFNWAPGEPNNHFKDEYCVETGSQYAADGTFNDQRCSDKYGVICKKRAQGATTPTPPPGTPAPPTCNNAGALISGKKYVQDFSFRASGSQSDRPPSKARMNSQTSWTADKTANGTYISVRFYSPMVIKVIQTKGAADKDEWVKKYQLQYRYDLTSPDEYYRDSNGRPKVFTANTNKNTLKANTLDTPVSATYVNIFPTEWKGKVSMRFEILGCDTEGCDEENIISGDSIVPDEMLTASSSKSNNGPDQARFRAITAGGTQNGWAAGTSNQNQWFQAELERFMRIRTIQTKGRKDQNHYVTAYNFQYSTDGTNWETYMEPYGTDKSFTGNNDQNSMKENRLAATVAAKYIRIKPKTWKDGIGMRLEVKGCRGGCNPVALINGNVHKVLCEQLQHSSVKLPGKTGVCRSKLNQQANGDKSGGWVAKVNDDKQWLKVDFQKDMYIAAIATQGRAEQSHWVTNFTVTYSTDGETWTTVKKYDSQDTKVFDGNWEKTNVRKHYFNATFNARYVRIHPLSFKGAVALRWEVYGCPGILSGRKLGCYAEDRTDADLDLPFETLKDPPGGMTYFRCMHHCFHKGYVIAGIRDGRSCSCGTTYGKYGPAVHCDEPCTGAPTTQKDCGNTNVNLVFSTGIGAEDVRCPGNWITYGRFCYQFISGTENQKTWADAQYDCRQRGGDLASPNSPAEQAFIGSRLAATKESSWIGLHCLRNQKSFEWSDGKSVDYTNWNRREPNSYQSDEDCVMIISSSGRWNDDPCSRKKSYVCQSNKKVNIQPPSPTPDPDCGENWVKYRWKCYHLHLAVRPWGWHNTTCTSMGGYLARIEDRFENSFLSAQIVQATEGFYWTDLSDRGSLGYYKWSDGRSPSYTHWAEGNPDNIDDETCVVIRSAQDRNGQWFDKKCINSNRFMAICEKIVPGMTVPPPTETPPPEQGCASGWMLYGSNCFEVKTMTPNFMKTWDDADLDCQSKGAELASIHNVDENDFVFRMGLAGKNGRFWIGLNAKDKDQGWVWSDGAGTNYQNWDNGQPDDKDGTWNCVEMSESSGLWTANDCQSSRNWICKIRRGQTPSYTTTKAPPSAGPAGSCAPDNDDWKYIKGRCYYFMNDNANWFNAELWCNNNGGNLVSIHGAQEKNFIKGQVMGMSTSYMWIGLNERSGRWEWSDKTPLEYIQWGPGMPNDNGGSEQCAAFDIRDGSFGKWTNFQCNTPLNFICTKHIGSTSLPPATTTSSPGGCPPGFMAMKNLCYQINEETVTWDEAFKRCTNRSILSNLVSINNDLEQAYLTSQMYNKGRNFWIGLRQYNDDTSQFWWTDNSPVVYTNWDGSEPNGGTSEQCVQMMHRPDQAGGWNDAACEGRNGYICMAYKDSQWPAPTPEPNDCPAASYVNWLGNCYKIASARARTWQEAEDHCREDGGTLASIRSIYEANLLYERIRRRWGFEESTTAWIGLSDKGTPGHFLWSDGGSLLYSNFGPGEPSRTEGGCFYIKGDGMWYHNDCDQPVAKALCKVPKEYPIVTQPPDPGSCPPTTPGNQWVAFGDNCYLFKYDDITNMGNARLQCHRQAEGGELASIQSDSEKDFLLSHLDAVASHNMWIGLMKTPSNILKWTNGDSVNYLNWNEGEPSDTDMSEGEDCVEMYSDSGLWNDIRCDWNMAYICMVPKSHGGGGSGTTKIPSVPSTSPASGATSPGSPPPTDISGPQPPSTSARPDMPGGPVAGGQIQLTSGGKIGIAFGAIFAVLAVAILVLIFRQRRTREENTLIQNAGFDNITYDSTTDSMGQGGGSVNVAPQDSDVVYDNINIKPKTEEASMSADNNNAPDKDIEITIKTSEEADSAPAAEGGNTLVSFGEMEA